MRPSAHSLSQGSCEKGCLHPPSLGKRPPPSSSPCRGPGGCSAAESAHVTGSSSSDQLQLCSKTSTISSVAGCRSLPPLPTAPSTLPAVLADHSPASIPAPGAGHQHRARTWMGGGVSAFGTPLPPHVGMERDRGGTRAGPEAGSERGAKDPQHSGARRGWGRGWGRERGPGAGSGGAPGRSPRAWAGSVGGAPGRGRKAPSSCCCCRRRRCAPT